MANKLFDQVGGIISLRLKGKNQESVINRAMTRGIFIWDIKKSGNDMQLKIRKSGYRALKSIAEEQGFELEVMDKQGLPFYRSVVKRRGGFLGGALFFVLALYFLSSFIWFIEVSGNKKIDSSRILAAACKQGIYEGALKWNFDCIEAEEAILRELSELSYIECDVRGVKAEIKVVEKILPGKDLNGPCHVVASRDGVVEEVLVLEGQSMVEKGKVVAKGDILISGIVFPDIDYELEEDEELQGEPRNLPYSCRARGRVQARTWYEGYGECALKTKQKTLTGREVKRLYVETPWKNFLLKGPRESAFSLYEQKSSRKKLNTPIGSFAIYSQKIREQSDDYIEYSEEKAVEIARERALKSLNKQMNDSLKIMNSKVDILSSPSDPILRVKISVETIEDIAVTQPINIVN